MYPRPDDPFPTPSDQLAPLYDGGLHDLFDSVLASDPSSAYSYDYEGQAQDLDHQFVSDPLFSDLVTVNEAHINADWTPGSGNRGTSDHDPMVSRWTLHANSAPTVSAGGPYTVGEGSSVTLTATASDPDGDPLTYSWDLNGDGTPDATGSTAVFNAAAIDGPADVTVRVTVSDGTDSATSTATVHVTNVAPTATFTAPSSASAPGSFTLSLTSPADASAADTTAGFQYAFDCGSGPGAWSAASSTTCTTADAGSRSVSGSIRDKDGGVTTYTANVVVTVSVDSLCQTIAGWAKNAGQANSLCVKLRNGAIDAFDHEVDAQTGKGLTADQAATLKRLAGEL